MTEIIQAIFFFFPIHDNTNENILAAIPSHLEMGLFRIQKCVHLFHFKRSFFKTGTRDLPIFGLRAQTHSGFGSHRDSEAGKASPKATKVNATDGTGRDGPPCDRRNAVACGPPVAPPAEESRRPSRSSPTLGGPRLFSTGDFL